MFIRFESLEVHEVSRRPRGVFHAAYDLAESHELPEWHRDALRDDLRWFEEKLPIPPRDRFVKGRGICWFRDGGRDSIARLWSVVAVLRECGVPVRQVCKRKPGLIVYEDPQQVVAVPWRGLR